MRAILVFAMLIGLTSCEDNGSKVHTLSVRSNSPDSWTASGPFEIVKTGDFDTTYVEDDEWHCFYVFIDVLSGDNVCAKIDKNTWECQNYCDEFVVCEDDHNHPCN